jgi:hypothetical protein
MHFNPLSQQRQAHYLDRTYICALQRHQLQEAPMAALGASQQHDLDVFVVKETT